MVVLAPIVAGIGRNDLAAVLILLMTLAGAPAVALSVRLDVTFGGRALVPTSLVLTAGVVLHQGGRGGVSAIAGRRAFGRTVARDLASARAAGPTGRSRWRRERDLRWVRPWLRRGRDRGRGRGWRVADRIA